MSSERLRSASCNPCAAAPKKKPRRSCGKPKPKKPKCGQKKKRRRSSCNKPKCKGGRKTANPFLNFLRFFRQKHCGWPACKIAIEGARAWCRLSDSEKQKYFEMACKTKQERAKCLGKCGKKKKSKCKAKPKKRRCG